MASFGARLSVEAQRWVRDGLISAAQAERILARYADRGSWLSRPVAALAAVGGGLIAAAIALLVAHNWEALHRWVKLGGLVVLMGAAYLGGLALRDRGHPRLGEGLFVVGGSLLLVGIALVGQIYNLSGRPSDAVLLWWVLLLPAAYALPSTALAGLGLAGAAAWYAWAMFDPGTLLGEGLQGHAAFPAVAIAALGLAYLGLGILHGAGAFRGVRDFLERLGLLALFAGLLPFGFLWRYGGERGWGGWVPWGRGDAYGALRGALFLLVLLAVAALVVGVAASRLPRAPASARAGFLTVVGLHVLYLAAVAAAVGFRAPAETVRLLAYADWLLLFGGPVAFILYGAAWGRTTWINWGVLVIGVHAVARYVDLFGTMVQTSLLFFTAGGLVLLLGWGLERMRRRMTAQAAARGAGA